MAAIQRQPSRREQFKLTGVKVLKDKVLGYGPCTIDVELDYLGLKCVGKKIHQALFMQGDTTAKVRQLKEQCQLLSQLRHPNIAMFFGLFFQQTPVLVAEYVPYTLASCMEQYGKLSTEIAYSVLHDVALGLSYLHNRTPAVVHGDLNATTVLLSPYMTAKISYLGVSKILRLTQANLVSVAQTSGTSVYLAPEITSSTGLLFTPSIDTYSFGILMVHMFANKQPSTSDYELPPTPGAESETSALIERVGKDHPTMGTILKCTSKNPEERPHVDRVVETLAIMASEYPSQHAHRLELHMHITSPDLSSISETEESADTKEALRRKREKLSIQSEELKRLKTENQLLNKQLLVDSKLAGKVINDLQEVEKQVPPT